MILATKIDKTNFHIQTSGLFTPCEIPSNAPDYISACPFSGKISSKYYYVNGGVIRVSDHWNQVASCGWFLKGIDKTKRCVVLSTPVAGFISFADLTKNRELSFKLLTSASNGNEKMRIKYSNQLDARLGR